MLRLSDKITFILENGGTLVVPSRQRAEAIRLAYAAAALDRRLAVWRTPDVLPLDAWRAREISRAAALDGDMPRLSSPAEEWVLWRNATEEATAGMPLVSQAPLAEALKRADQLASEFEIDTRALRNGGAEQALLFRVRQRVMDEERTLGSSPAHRLAATLPALGDGRTVAFAGFGSLTPQLHALVEARRAHGLDTLLLETPAATVSQGSRRVVRPDDSAAELEEIASWCRERIADQPDARLLVMLPGSPSPRQRLVSLIHQALDPARSLSSAAGGPEALAAIEGGEPLGSRPMVAQALGSLHWLVDGSDFEGFSEWLRSPYWHSPRSSERHRLDLWLREHASLEPDVPQLLALLQRVPSSLEPAAGELSARIGRAMQKLGRASGSPREWSERLHGALDALGWPGERQRDSNEQQTCERLLDLLKELGSLAPATGTLTRNEAIRWLTELAGRTAFSPASGDALVTVSPLLCDPIAHYDGIWVAGLNAEAWPQSVQPDPFLPLQAQRTAGVPAASAAGRLEQARELMAAWNAAAAELVLSAPCRAQDMELLPSPLLAEPEIGTGPTGPAPAWLPSKLRREGMTESILDVEGVPWPAGVPLPAGTFSLQLQNECPFRAYAELRLGSSPLEAPQPGIEADVRGRLLHLSLEKLWSRLRDSRALQSLSDPECDALIAECVDEAADFLWRTEPGAPPQVRERRRTRRLISALCALERERFPFNVAHTELESLLRLGEAELRLRIDRIDALEAGGSVILDYKSGRRTPADWYGERPSHVQLMAYLAAIGGDVRAMATVNVTAREVRFDGIAAAADLLPKVARVEGEGEGEGEGDVDVWPVRVGEWRAILEKLAGEFVSGWAAVDPKPGACDYCHVASLCRIAERGAVQEEGPGDE